MGPIILICFPFHALIKEKTKRKQNGKQKTRNPNADPKRVFYWRLQQFSEKKRCFLTREGIYNFSFVFVRDSNFHFFKSV